MKFDVVINTDDNYIQHCMAMLCSLYENNKDHTITLHILSNKLNSGNKNLITAISGRYNNNAVFHNIDEARIGEVQFRKQRPLSKAAYYRLLLGSVLDLSIHKVLYLDCDMIVLQDVSSLFELEIDEFGLAACRDDFPYTDQHRKQLHMECGEKVFCSGIMLVNLDFWRAGDYEEKLLEYAHRTRKEVHLHDQDVLNYVFKKKWFVLPPKWNRNAYIDNALSFDGLLDYDYNEYTYHPVVLHYASVGMKPWISVNFPNRKPYLHYLALSEYPNPVFQKGNLTLHLKAAVMNTSIWLNRYVWPYTPKLLKTLVSDILGLLVLPFRLLYRNSKQ